MESTYTQDSPIKQNVSNLSTIYSYTLSEPEDIIAVVEEYAVPIICIFGIIGNTISAFVFLHKVLRGNSSSLFLAARSISDNGFLATLLTIWASSVYGLHLGSVPGLCQALIFFTYFFGCVSVWLVVFVTAENYIRICRPFLVKKMCNTTNAKISMIILLALVLSIYNFPFWTMAEQCTPYRKYYDFIQIMVYIDSVLTLIVPSTIMTGLTSAIVATTIASCKRRSRRMSTCSVTTAESPLTRVTNMLLAVTLTFFILNLPHHAVRFRLMILAFVEKQSVAATLPLEITMQSISHLLYYLSLAINVVIYSIFSSKFRTTIKDFAMRRATRRNIHTRNVIPSYPMRRADLSLQEFPGKRIKNNNEETFPLRRFQSSIL
ncbi:galanin receptor type 2-like [Mercenaria mercenaria]|uniref:galanin receptor type 2-like n=1 Tax=Mercenaria mercenaria TaxID=6596 RepID=UPI001E1DB54B|nr:galanin receptor type 2-like [Mercenaria mercenaria]